MPIKTDLDKLKTAIHERMTEIETNNTLVVESQKSFDRQAYQEVVEKATQMLTWNLTEEQKSVASSLLEAEQSRTFRNCRSKQASNTKGTSV